MEKLPMCRICLVENIQMFVVVNKNLHEMYERLTDIPFVTDDSRPILACSFCCAKLKQSFRLLRKCLEAEERFTQIINGSYEPKPLINQDHLEVAHEFICSPIESISIVEVDQTESIVVKEELPANCERQDDVLEPKEDDLCDDLELENLDKSRLLDEEDILARNSKFDSEDDVYLMEFKIEEEAQQEARKEECRAMDIKSPAVAEEPKLHLRRTKLEDSMPADQKTNQISDLKIIPARKLSQPLKNIPRKRTRTTTKASWTVDSLENAVSVLKRGGISVYKVSQQTGIPYSTLKKRYNLAKADDSSYKNSPKLGRHTVFNVAQEEILANHLRTMSNKLYGLTREQFRKVCYSVAKQLGIEKRFNQVNRTAGKDWLAGFLQRHPDLRIRKPEAISCNESTDPY